MEYLVGFALIILGMFGFVLAAILPILPVILVIVVCGGVLKGILKLFR